MPYQLYVQKTMMYPAVKVVFLLSLFTSLGIHARNLPEDILKISNTDHVLTSSFASIIRPPKKSPPPPQVNPPTHPIMTVSYVTEHKDDIIIRMPKFTRQIHRSPPPAPYVAPPRDQKNANRGKAPEPSHFSQQVASAHCKLRSFSYVTGNPHNAETVKRPKLLSPLPPHIQMEVYATK